MWFHSAVESSKPRLLSLPAIAAVPLDMSITLSIRCAGVLLSREELERAAELTARAGAWLIMDNTYEHFVYEGLQHHCVSAPHIIHLFSFSKVSTF